MTGFSTEEVLVEPYRLIWEVRSVNHRFLDINLRLPDELRTLEPRCRAMVGVELRRGKVDCTLKISAVETTADTTSLQADALNHLNLLERDVQRKFPDARRLAVSEILRWPGVLKEASTEPTALEGPIAEGFSAALQSLSVSRQREGERLADLLLERCNAIDEIVEGV